MNGLQLDWLLQWLQQNANLALAVFGFIILIQVIKPRFRRNRRNRPNLRLNHSSNRYSRTKPRTPFSFTNHAPDDLLRQLQGKPVLTPTEIKFFWLLRRSVPELLIFPQVSLQAVLKVPAAINLLHGWQLRRALGGKHADFLVCRRDTMQIVAFIELDDPSHDAPERQQSDRRRDLMIGAAGYRILRYDVRQWPKTADLKSALAINPSNHPTNSDA